MLKINGWKVFGIIVMGMLLFQCGLFAVPQKDDLPGTAPVNPDFIRYQAEVQAGTYSYTTKSGYPLGFAPSPVDISHIRGVVDKSVIQSYPSSYDLRTTGKLTSVKNQGQCGACWTFGIMASLESYLKPGETRDFAEQHLNATHGFDYAECAGGNGWMGTAYFARWDGPLNESDYPYTYTSVPASYTIQKHIQQSIFLPNRSSYTDNDTIKYFVTNYGAIICSYQSDDENYNNTYHSYYYNGEVKTNHIVAIVGWDDNFSASKFNTTPPGNGAFIVKNSWGTNWSGGENGYFYLSYYDTSMKYLVSFNNAESTSNYTREYSYDPLGWVQGFGWPDETAWGANIFTAIDSNPIKAVGFYLNDAGSSYEIYVYKGVSAGQPRSGTLAATASGSKSYSGYYTATLSSSVFVSAGERFSVVIKFTNPGGDYPIAIESPYSGYATQATANSGESFYSHYGSNWSDITTAVANANICIKAFAGTGSSSGSQKISNSQKTLNYSYNTGGSYSSSQQTRITNSGTGTLAWSLTKSSGASWLSFSPSSGTNSGNVTVSVSPTGLSAGTYSGTITVSDPGASNSPQTITVNLTVKSSSQSGLPFGDFATPVNGASVSSSIAVTGWVLDDVEVTSLKLYNGNTYIGDASFIEGARPDVQTAYPTYPFSYKAGWGYMLLTNFLPNGGNGYYTIITKATDKEGHVYTLGSKTIYVDNAHAVKPFGAIDTPTQGGTASGKEYVNFGWVLTPGWNYIPTNGSTIGVYIDGVSIGSPGYNQYRSDIAALFPDYTNSDGAGGYMYIDTRSYSDGVHTIQWIATDSGGNGDGIGSRYFTVQNASSLAQPEDTTTAYSNGRQGPFCSLYDIRDIPVEHRSHTRFIKGYDEEKEPQVIQENEDHRIQVTTREDERIKITLSERNSNDPVYIYTGYQMIGNQLVSLPVGSTLDSENGIFYWQPGPGFIGEYDLVFIASDSAGPLFQKQIRVKINPKFSK